MVVTRAALLGLLVAGGLILAAAAPAPPDPGVQQSMAEIVAALGLLLPASLDDDAWEDPTGADDRKRAMAQLSISTRLLREHARGESDALEFLATSLAADAAMIETAYVLGEEMSARYRIQGLVETCVACHSRLPDFDDSALGRRITKTVEVQALPHAQRAALLAATRQWEDALVAYESLLAPGPDPARGTPLDRFWSIPEYVEVSVRVRGDLGRPVPTLAAFASDDEVPGWVARAVHEWIAALRAIEGRRIREGTELAAARDLIEEARAAGAFPAERTGFVHYVAASSLLHRMLDRGDAPVMDKAEAYYLLGVTESHIGVRGWLSLTEFYLERAIRTAPDAPWAAGALTALEFHLTVEFSGPEGLDLPSDLRALLDQLRALVDAHAAP